MAYDEYDRSIFKGKPVDLYEFSIDGNTYYYTSCRRDIKVKDKTYQSAFLSRSNIVTTQLLAQEKDFTITCEIDFPLVQQIKTLGVFRTCSVRIFRMHLTDPDQELRTIWIGRVRGFSIKVDRVELPCDSAEAACNRCGLRMNYQTSCNHMLYSKHCHIKRKDWQVSGVVESVSGDWITTKAAIGDSGLTHGLITIRGYSSMINAHEKNRLELFNPIPGLVAGDKFVAWHGCDKTLTTCAEKFNNSINFKGFPYSPKDNPFEDGV